MSVGIDIGTMNVVKARESEKDDSVIIIKERNCFYTIRPENSMQKMALQKSGVKFIDSGDGELHLIGEKAYQKALGDNADLRRPFKDGLLNKEEENVIPIVKTIIQSVLGNPVKPGEICATCIPGIPVQDKNNSLMYHSDRLRDIIQGLGFNVILVNEALAVVASLLSDNDFAGVGISFGSGMVNVAVSSFLDAKIQFSIKGSGDWIDEQVARYINGYNATSVIERKETELDLTIPTEKQTDEVLYALSSAYDGLIDRVVKRCETEFNNNPNMPRFRKKINVAIAGGTSMPKGFAQRLSSAINNANWKINIDNVITAGKGDAALYAVAKGLLCISSFEEANSK
jgi:actin-like ATPase involved in cell morphogenesis